MTDAKQLRSILEYGKLWRRAWKDARQRDDHCYTLEAKLYASWMQGKPFEDLSEESIDDLCTMKTDVEELNNQLDGNEALCAVAEHIGQILEHKLFVARMLH